MNLTLDRQRAIQHFTGINLRVLVNGVDVSDRCIEASAEAGWAWCFKLNADGKKYRDDATREAAREKLTGVVTYVRKAEPVEP